MRPRIFPRRTCRDGLSPLVKELASDGIHVQVSCRGLKLSRQPYYRWLRSPVTGRDLAQAYRANALHDTHLEDPEFGYRFLADEAKSLGEQMANRTAWRLCRDQQWWSAFGKKKTRGKSRKPGPPVHDDLVQREFVAAAPNELWLSDFEAGNYSALSPVTGWPARGGVWVLRVTTRRWSRSLVCSSKTS